MRRVLWCFLVVGACASEKAVETPAPDPAVPTSVTVLDSTLTVPGYIHVQELVRKPGMARFKWRDDVSTCSGAALFETVADPADHETFMRREVFEPYEASWEQEGVTRSHDDTELTLWSGPARLRTWTLTRKDREGATATLDRHLREESLSVVMVMDCPAPALAHKQAETWVRVLEGRKRL